MRAGVLDLSFPTEENHRKCQATCDLSSGRSQRHTVLDRTPFISPWLLSMMMSIVVVSLTLCREPACGVQDRSISFRCLYSATRNRKLTSYDWTATRIVYMHSSKMR